MNARTTRWAAGAAGCLAVWALSAAVTRRGVPPGIVLQGLVLGALTGLTAMGLVLVYRSARIVNFAQAEIGILASTVGIVMVAGFHVPYLVAAPLGLAAAVLTGLVIDAVVLRRLRDAPRLIVTVATVGIYELLGALEIEIPRWFKHNLSQLTRFQTPFAQSITFHLRPYRFDGNSVLVLLLVPPVLAGLAWFLGRSDIGIAIRASADSGERASLLGIPVRRLSRLVWMIAAGLSGLAALLQAPILGQQVGGVGGAAVLLPPLAAAVAARMDSLPRALLAAMGIEVFEQAVFWNSSQSHTVDVAVFAVVLVALLVQRRRLSRFDDAGLGDHAAVREVRPIPAVLKVLPEVRAARAGGWVALATLTIALPWSLTDARLIVLAYVCLYGVVAVSLVILTGWAGQISFGQFAFVGVGAGMSGMLLAHAGADLFEAVLAAGAVGAVAAVLVGLPALRIRGLFLAVATLAFALPVSTYLLNHAYFPTFTPEAVAPPVLLERFPLGSPRAFYYLCLAVLVVAVVLARNFRRTRAGRVVVAVRDNERGAAALSISPVRAKLVAFGLAGALAGVAGGLWVVAQRGINFSGFDPSLSLEVFTAVVVGGLGSLAGAIAGAVYVEQAQHFHGGVSLLATGGGLLLLLEFLPGGFGEVGTRARDALLRIVARRRGLSVPSLREGGVARFALGDRPSSPSAVADGSPPPAAPKGSAATGDGSVAAPILRVEAVDAGYGPLQVLFGVDFEVGDGELLALLGTNGAGKSTVLRSIAGLLPPQRGRVLYDGRDLAGMTPAERAAAGIVTVPGGRGVFPSLTVAEHLRLAGWTRRGDAAHLGACMRQVFELFPVLAERSDVAAGQLSGGEQQMLTLAQALYLSPRVLLIDELSLGLAPSVVAVLLDAVRRLHADGVAVVVVEQSTNVAAGLAHRAVFLERGQVRFTGPTEGLLERPDLLRSIFLGGASERQGRPVPSRRSMPTQAAPARRRRRFVEPEPPRPVPRLELRDLRFHYGGVSAVDGLDLEVGPGEIVGLIGNNGAGKTTVLDLTSGFLRPASGRVRISGEDVTDLGAPERAERGLGRSFQDARLFPSMTVGEAIAVALERHIEVRDPLLCLFATSAVIESERAVARRVDELVELLNLGRYREAFVSELSTGTRRVVELACAMAHGPDVLLLDEPSSGIAQRETEALGPLLHRIRDETGASLVVVEHDIPLVSSISDRLVCLELGRVISAGPPDDVLADPLVVASYLGTDPLALARSGARAPATATTAQAPGSGRKPTTRDGPGRPVAATSSTRP